jgi:hypothetical protein
MIIHLVDGTYELFRHFYGIRRFKKTDPPLGAVSGVLSTVVQLLDDGGTHVGVATDHIIESFRNTMWAGPLYDELHSLLKQSLRDPREKA